ncbi:MAG: aminotransferase class I/II-fold pyridoxal phosphate-dependent enzyme [Oscillospiraceae bacterium]|nr:aminotransferase class I/II-fold pyridoxal phosphate-dependent enzyme [Oscillospiraceae bacterium]
MGKRIALSTPHMSDEGYELEYIHDAFRKNWIAPLGENVNEFEKSMGSYIGAGYPVALSAGTAALHLSMILAGVKAGDKVFCQSLTFSASANPVTYVGAEPVFIDSDYETWNMDPDALEKAFELYGKPAAVVVVHLYGNPARLDRIAGICEKHHVPLIEDAAEALGSEYHGKKCGTFGKYGILSFNGNKIITTSGGGMLLCDNEMDAKHALKLATQAREPLPWYQHEEIGFNYRMSNIVAGIGRGQMKVLPLRVQQKRAICARYAENLAGLPLTFQPEMEHTKSNRWLTSILLNEGCGVTPAELLDALNAENIEGRHLWKPMHAQPVFAKNIYVTAGEISVSDDLFARGVCLPSDSKMTMEDVDRVCGVIRKVLA